MPLYGCRVVTRHLGTAARSPAGTGGALPLRGADHVPAEPGNIFCKLAEYSPRMQLMKRRAGAGPRPLHSRVATGDGGV